jgi:hypothetical protein
MLGKAVGDGLIHQAPRIHLAEETGRDGILDDATEAKLLEVANQPLRDVILIVRDMGLRPAEVFCMRWEHVHWDKRLYFKSLRQIAESPPLGAVKQPRIRCTPIASRE